LGVGCFECEEKTAFGRGLDHHEGTVVARRRGTQRQNRGVCGVETGDFATAVEIECPRETREYSVTRRKRLGPREPLLELAFLGGRPASLDESLNWRSG
jgi:hypothetical protein